VLAGGGGIAAAESIARIAEYIAAQRRRQRDDNITKICRR